MLLLVAEVYEARIDNHHTLLNVYGRHKLEAQVVAGGVKFAAVDQFDLKYDPTRSQRDWSELDWDEGSIALE